MQCSHLVISQWPIDTHAFYSFVRKRAECNLIKKYAISLLSNTVLLCEDLRITWYHNLRDTGMDVILYFVLFQQILASGFRVFLTFEYFVFLAYCGRIYLLQDYRFNITTPMSIQDILGERKHRYSIETKDHAQTINASSFSKFL